MMVRALKQNLTAWLTQRKHAKRAMQPIISAVDHDSVWVLVWRETAAGIGDVRYLIPFQQ